MAGVFPEWAEPNTQLELFVTGLLYSAAAELPFDLYVKLVPPDHDWKLLANYYGWQFQSYYWGDPNSPD